ncbi:ParB N-terminal domain-containing protein [Urbifossiella limnaea]|nr:ParB N-terminal domain-containing protein [Urbifossiella limnaea]
MKSITFNETTYTCPFLDVMPPLAAEERAELKADIASNGITYPVIVTEEHEVIDGHNRLEIATELGLTAVPVTVLTGLSGAQKRVRAVDLNLHRRHLTRDRKREVIAHRLRNDPGRSNRDIAAEVKADGKTVAAVRGALEATAEIPRLAATRGRDGKTRSRPGPQARDIAAAARKHKAEEAAPAAAARPHAENPGAGAARWSELQDIARSAMTWVAALSRLGRARAADRDPGRVSGAADRLQRVVDELRLFVDRYTAGTAAPAPPGGGTTQTPTTGAAEKTRGEV